MCKEMHSFLVVSCKGVFGIMWYILWLLLAYASPAEHPTITEEERMYIEAAIGETVHQISVTEVCSCNKLGISLYYCYY